jgi:N-acetylglutamate synthase-like GNAT family acetyltransferase
MPRLHVEEYTRAYSGKAVLVACREGILRDHFNSVIADIKFLTRQGIHTTFFHNMSNRFANQKHFKTLASKLPETRMVRVPPETDFYEYVLDYQDHGFKLIFLERKCLVDQEGLRINSLTTRGARESTNAFGDLIANANYKNILEKICSKIEHGKYERVHILPAGKNTVKHELFTVEGSGTLIANNFNEVFSRLASDEEASIIAGILASSKREGYLKPRTLEYIQKQRQNFYVTKIDEIIVGCAESKRINTDTVELGALAISTKFRNQRVAVFTVNAFIAEMANQGYRRFVSLTNNPKLQKLYLDLGFMKTGLPQYYRRQKQSPGVDMFYKEIKL